MQLSTRARYAVMAMVELGCHEQAGRGGPVTLAQIAASQQLSLCYLEQLFGGLRRAGLVLSVRGPGGGYRLGRPAAEVTVAEIIDAVDEPIHTTRCTGDIGCMLSPDGGQTHCCTHELWRELGQHIRQFLSAVSLAEVVRGQVGGQAGQRLLTEEA
jgi:Rrf2 family iron-sulfur cluster assembly transcriptional regulator